MSTDNDTDAYFVNDDALTANVEELLEDIGDLDLDDDEEVDVNRYNMDHIELMRQQILQDCQINNDIHSDSRNDSQNTDASVEPIDKIIIKKTEYLDMNSFNRYLSSIILNMLDYAERHNGLYRVNGTEMEKYRVSSYDKMMRHIPSHRHFAFTPKAASSYAATATPSKYDKSKLFRSVLMKNENVEINASLSTLSIDHLVNIESLKLIHDILQLSKESLLSVSFTLRLYNNDDGDDLPTTSLNVYETTSSYESNMMISCISSILKLCETMKSIERFNFDLINFNRECYDYFTHFSTESDAEIFVNLKDLTIHIDDDLSQTEVQSFPFYAFAASPMLAFLKKLKSLQSISIIIDDRNTKRENKKYEHQFTVYWIKKLCDKIFEIMNKSHPNLCEFYFKNTRSDCGTSEFFKEMLINFIKKHHQLRRLTIILYDLCDENLALLIDAIYKSCIKHLSELTLYSKTCMDVEDNNDNNIQRSLRHHYADLSLSALLHLIYISSSLHKLSLLCFYSADTIKFNALMSAIKSKDCIRYFRIAQLRKDNDTLYSLSKLFKKNRRIKSVVCWQFYESLVISFGVEFGHFYHGNKVNVCDMKLFIDLIFSNQLLMQQSKLNLLNVLNKAKVFVPNDVLWIVIQFSLGKDSFNISLLQWNLMDKHELHLLFQTMKYFKAKYIQLMNQYNTSGIKHIHRKIKWFDREWPML